MNVLVTGGTGYIGSHLVRLLTSRGDSVIVVDDVETGNVTRIGDVPLIKLELAREGTVSILAAALAKYDIDAVVHLAGRKQVGESVARPAWYYQQNVVGLANVLLAMEKASVDQFIFSSSAAVYASSDGPVTELSSTRPISPYGETKLVGEWLTRDATVARNMKAVSLRYFNVAGAVSRELADTAALNLIPMVMEKIVAGESPVIYGESYSTPDGTCIRDYVHVQDVAEAHLAAIDGLGALDSGHHIFNVGTGRGASVREIVDALLAASGAVLEPIVTESREGDAAVVIADVSLIESTLGWHSRFDIHDIIHSAWAFRIQ